MDQQIYRQPSKDNVVDPLRNFKNAVPTTSTGASQKNISMKEKSQSQHQEAFDNIQDTQAINSQIVSKKEIDSQVNTTFPHHTHQGSHNSSLLYTGINSGDGHHQASVTHGQNVNKHLSNKSDSNLNQNSVYNIKNGDGKNRKEDTDTNKRRKLSEKQNQRRTSNNRTKGDGHTKDTQIPPIDGANYGADKGPNRSVSKGNQKAANISQNMTNTTSQGDASMIKGQPPQFVNGPQFFDQAQGNFNPFQNNQFQQNYNANGFAGGMAQMSQTHGFPFGAGGGGPFMGGGQPAPQVHFIARKQQFIAQISPEQLAGSDKRPYTAQSLNGLSTNTKRAGSVYANAMGIAGKNAQGAYNDNSSNNAAMLFIEGANYLPYSFGLKNNHKRLNLNHAAQRQTQSIYGEDPKGKGSAKDPTKTLGSSNGFSSGYTTDPYNSVMSQGLPATFTHSSKPTKGKAGNRLQGKEKEQLYDETIKMKMLNNQMREEHVKLKTKIKILENELGRKEKTIEDLFNHNQIIQQAQSKHQSSSNQNLLPLAQTAQKYQQETFLVMSLKKQIRELKLEVVKRDEELEVARKNIKNTRTQEFEQELQTYHDECLRLRAFIEDLMKQGSSHPIYSQVVTDQMADLEAQLQQKDLIIQKMQENRISTANIYLNDEKVNSLPGVKSQEGQPMETHASEFGAISGSASAQTQGGRDKSADRKQNATAFNQQQQKETQKEMMRTRKALRDREKELAKAKADILQFRKENAEKVKTGAGSKDGESQVKSLKDKLLVQKGEARRREERLTDADTKLKRLEESLQSVTETLRQQEDSNKSLKAQLRTSKQKQKAAAEATSQANQSQPDSAVQSTSKKSLTPVKQREKQPEKSEKEEKSEKASASTPTDELRLITLIGQREKLCRDDLTAMMMAGEDSLRMLIKEPSQQLVEFVKANLHDEDTLLSGIPRYEIPRSDFERQVLREMRIVLKDNIQKITEMSKGELMPWSEFYDLYKTMENFEYPHKDKLLEFIKYFFLDHIVNKDVQLINYQAFKEHLLSKRPPGATPERSRNPSHLRSGGRSQDSSKSREGGAPSADRKRDKLLGATGSDIGDDEKGQEEEKMLDIAEQCFMRVADLLHVAQRTVRQVFLRYSQPELFKDGSVLELLSPRGFLEGIKDVGFEDVTELEAACLMKVLAKPELDNAVILNEFVLIMENFGVPVLAEEDEYENDYIQDSDNETPEATPKASDGEKKEESKKETEGQAEKSDGQADKPDEQHMKFAEKRKSIQKNSITLKFDALDEKGHKIMKKLARFLLERYMHPREFFGPTIKKEPLGKKKSKVEVIKLHDFYLRIKLASIRKKIKENVSLNQFMAIDGDKYPGFIQVKRMIKALEVVAEKEQEHMVKEQEEKQKEHLEKIKVLAEERAAQGLPTLTEEELDKLISLPEEEKKDEKKVKDYLESADSKKHGKPGLEEVVKLGGKPPKGEREVKSRFASVHGPGGQLNTIEEDLHETQTSHYSYQVKEGDQSDRDGSKHQLSTHLRNSAALQEIEDSGHRSAGGRGLPVGQSVHSADYSEQGSISSNKKKSKDIESSDVHISEFRDFKNKKKATDPMVMSHDVPETMGMKQKTVEDPMTGPARTPNGVISGMSMRNNIPQSMNHSKSNKLALNDEQIDENDYDIDFDEQKMKDELDHELNKKIDMMAQESLGEGEGEDEDSPSKETTKKANVQESDEDNYSDDQIDDLPDGSNQRPSKLSQESAPEDSQLELIANEQLDVDKQKLQTKNKDVDSEGEEDYEF